MADEKHRLGAFLPLFATIALGMFLDGLDSTIVNIALPEITSDLGMGTSTASWIVTVYFLVMAGLILIFGKICDSGGIRKVLLGGFLVFSLGSFMCGVCPGFELLLASRAVQGVGAAMLAASSVMLSVQYLPSRMTGFGLALGLLGSSVGAAFGPALGGVLTETFSWHWIFFINVPIGIIAFLIARKAVPKEDKFVMSSFDIRGSVLLFASLVFGLYAVESVPSHGITTASGIALVLFVVLFAVFVLSERRVENPVINLRLFRSLRFDAVVVTFIILNMCYMGILYLLPFFLNIEMGLDTMGSSLYMLVPAVATLATCLWIGRLSDRLGNKPFVVIGCVFLTAAMTLFAMTSADVHVALLIAGLALAGLVWGVAGGPVGSRVIQNVPRGERGSGSAFLSFFIYFGSALGTAAFSGLFAFGSGTSGQSIADLTQALFLDGFHFAMLVGVALALIGLILSIAVKDQEPVTPESDNQ